MAEDTIRYSMAGCPMCGHYGPHFETTEKPSQFTCRLCGADFGVGKGAIETMLVFPPVPAGTASA